MAVHSEYEVVLPANRHHLFLPDYRTNYLARLGSGCHTAFGKRTIPKANAKNTCGNWDACIDVPYLLFVPF
ncbi:hypothetical protein B0A64_09335 [Flavobacterium araucananum]|uniref:Uncharacterized protein n=1 Tax=Flavobacterium araucananum TaxID=946678 RepID=A0A227PBZ2_9FLAO|nr:hypothetical protein B0A64_09335 [Flavobacterium araucananum]